MIFKTLHRESALFGGFFADAIIKKGAIMESKAFKNISDLSFKYLFNDKSSEYNGQYFSYDLIYESLKQPSEKMILFKVSDNCEHEIYEMKLYYEDDSFFIVSEYLDDKDLPYSLECFSKEDEIVLYKNFGDGELYLHIEYEKEAA